MKRTRMPDYLLTEKGLIIAAAALVLSALVFLNWNSKLNRFLKAQLREYRMDLALSENKQEHERVYREILSQGAVPKEGRQDQNEWIRNTQAMVHEYGLQLREVTPVTEEAGDENNITKLFLLLEGDVKQWVGFLHGLASSGNSAYVESFNVALLGDQSNSVRIEMMLARLPARQAQF